MSRTVVATTVALGLISSVGRATHLVASSSRHRWRLGMRQLPPQYDKTTIVSQRAVLAVCLTVMAGGAGAQKTTSASLDSASIAALRRMGTYLRSLNRFTVDAQTMLDEVLSDGETATLAGTVSYTVRTPDRLWADIRTD